MRLLVISALMCANGILSGCAAVMATAAAHSAAIATVAEAAPMVLAAGAVAAVAVAGNLGSQTETYPPDTLGAYLHEGKSAVDVLVRGAMQDQRESVVVAGLQAQRAFARARIAFRATLDARIGVLAEPERNFKSDMARVLADLNSASAPVIKNAGDRAQAIADKMRLPEGAPQVRSYGPVFLFPFLPFQTINVSGSFPADYANGKVPQLTIDGKSYKAFTYQAQGLAFSIPTADIDSGEDRKVVWKRAELAIPWDGMPLFDAFSRAGYENFLLIGLLPHSLGRATIEHRIETVRREEMARISGEFTLDRGGAAIEESRCLALSAQEVSDGWRIKPGSAAFVPKGSADGKTEPEPLDAGVQSENERAVCWRVRSRENAGDGELPPWRISARIWRDVKESGVATESIDLNWGRKQGFRYAAGSWKLRYANLDGSIAEIESASLANPLVRIQSDAASVTVSTYPF